MYARVAQEPGMESRRSAKQNDTARDTEPIGRREVGARSRSDDVGEPAPGDPAEQRSAPMNRLVGGKDDRDSELAGRLNQARTNSETGEGQARGQPVDAGPPHRWGLVTRGLPPHAEG